ncbi:MAG: YjjG family noncanonical pyrimidine nucleotidase [Clostridia bacterium]|nr:YjjG family noncanonical pyrimidine nucleotidase [Clostridia bacterium]
MIKNLLFDLDMTLLDFKAAEQDTFKIVANDLELEYSDEFYDVYSIANEKCWKKLELQEITKAELYVIRFRETIEWYIANHPEFSRKLPSYEDINAYYIKTMSKIGIRLPGAMEFILKVKEVRPDLNLYIITNGTSATARGRVKASGFEPLFEKVFVSDEIGINKPDKKFFDAVLAELNSDASECLVIGDSLSSDILGAKNAGIKSLWYTESPDENAIAKYSISFVAGTFDEMLDIIEKI